MKKPLALLALCAWLSISLTGCAKGPETGSKADGTGATTAEKGKTAEEPGKGAGETAATGPAAGEEPAAETAEAGQDQAAAPPNEKVKLPQVDAAQKKINVEDLPNNMQICTVAGHPVTVGDYRRMFKLQQIQMQTLVSTNPLARQRMLEEAKNRGISLTKSEKDQLLSAARGGKGAGSADFKKFLKEKNATEEQFNKEVLDVGVALKAVNTILQQNLLNDMVNRELLCDAGKAAGLETKAMNRYVEIKHSPTYKQLVKATGFSASQLKDEIVKAELTKLMVERIQSRAKVTDKEVEAFYKKNPNLFKHQERVRLSQIFIAAPTVDSGPIESVKTQVKKQKPELSDKELEAVVALTIQTKKQKAQEILERAKSGADFNELANEFTEDLPSRAAKTGGDMGYQEKGQLIPEFAAAVWPLKKGEVYSGLVQTPLGFHIVKVTAHEGAGPVPLAEVKELVRAGLVQQKGEQVLSQWLRDKRRNVEVVLSPQFAQMLTAQQPQPGIK